MIRFDPVLLRYAIGDKVVELPPAEMRVLNVLLHSTVRIVQTSDLATLIYGESARKPLP
jgi:DNA-binding winged helix-turn-helix (wHTH) protein